MFCRETMLVFLEGCSEKIGGPNQTVEIDDSKFGRRKYHRGHTVQGQWVFGGIERESGRLFLVPITDRTADTLEAIIRNRIEPSTVISDCWGAYNKLDSLGYTHRTVNHSLHFVHPDTWDHTNTIQSTWHRVKLFLGPYNRRTTFTILRIICSWRGASHKEFHLFYNFFTSLPTHIGLRSTFLLL
jgi:transposase-like protein